MEIVAEVYLLGGRFEVVYGKGPPQQVLGRMRLGYKPGALL